jgi:hypothetical protein
MSHGVGRRLLILLLLASACRSVERTYTSKVYSQEDVAERDEVARTNAMGNLIGALAMFAVGGSGCSAGRGK